MQALAMELAVVAYPNLADADRRWIESFRARHDPQALLIDVHFTLVFPFAGTPDQVGDELAAAARGFGPIPFAIRETRLVAEDRDRGTHLFLIPDQGSAEIRSLHHRLYAGALRSHLRPDIPFVPHMTIGFAAAPQPADQWTSDLETRPPLIQGMLSAIELVEVSAPRVRTVAVHGLNIAGNRQ